MHSNSSTAYLFSQTPTKTTDVHRIADIKIVMTTMTTICINTTTTSM